MSRLPETAGGAIGRTTPAKNPAHRQSRRRAYASAGQIRSIADQVGCDNPTKAKKQALEKLALPGDGRCEVSTD